ncbi:hypothetical protein [Chondromyces crocatus]|uniref:Uncharacterized protein n=1 Tax=Chondromyces crocatus TaxID=52 RepID=A0A0K1EPB6_CHOCO|nr:hypothetical protein [Chondromyces crocatus]AKT42691.1 uncharacterized protein CMC5_069180 [Chondromyces crocatus]
MSTQSSRLGRSFRHLASMTQAALLLSLPACAGAPDAETLGASDQAVTVFPGVIAVSGEVALGTPTSGPAARHQDRPAIAWNGDHYLLVWQDDRRSSRDDLRDTTDLWVARVNADGTFIDPVGKLLIEHAEAPAITTDGTDFLITFSRNTGDYSFRTVEVARVSAAGDLLSEAQVPGAMVARVNTAEVAFDGMNYVVAWADGNAHYTRVSPQGVVLDGGGTTLAGAHQVDVAFDGTNTLIVTNDDAGVKGYRVDSQGNLVDGAPLTISLTDGSYGGFYDVGVACTGGVCTVVWSDLVERLEPSPHNETVLQAARVTSSGVLLDAQPITIVSKTQHGEPFHIDVGIDGQDAVVVADLWHEYDVSYQLPATVLTARVSSQGLPVGTPHILASPGTKPGVHSAIAKGGPRPLVVWSDQSDRHGLWHNNDIKGVFLDANGPVGASLLLQSASDQRHPSVAFDGENFVVAWTDGRNGHQGRSLDVYATRVSPSAQVLDLQGVLLSTSTFFTVYGPAQRDLGPRVAFDGEKAVVGYLNCNGSEMEPICVTAVSRLSRAGAALDAMPLNPLMSSWVPTHAVYTPELISGDGEVLVVEPNALATAHIDPSGQVTTDFPSGWPAGQYFEAAAGITSSASDGAGHLFLEATYDGQVQGARLALDGTLLDGGARFSIAPPGTQAASVTAAFDGENYLVVWLDKAGPAPRILASRVTSAGAVVDTTPVLLAEYPGCNDVALNAQGAVRGRHRTIVAWRACGPDGADLFGAALDEDLTAEHFTLTSDAFTDQAPALASSGPHILVTYSSRRLNTPLGAERVYARLLADVPPISVTCSMPGGVPAGSAAPLVGLGLLALVSVKRRRAR